MSQPYSIPAVAPEPVETGFGQRARMALGRADTVHRGAADCLAALGQRRAVVPLRLGKALTLGLGMLPRRLPIAVMGRIMAGMIQPNSASRHG